MVYMQFSKPFHIIFHIFIISCLIPVLVHAVDEPGIGDFQVESSPLIKKSTTIKGGKGKLIRPVVQEKPLVFLVHGAKAKNETWYRPGGDFHDELSARASVRGLGEIVPITWSGKSGPPEGRLASVQAHIKAANYVVDNIIERVKGRPRRVVLVGHSYGGAILKLVTHMLDNPHLSKKKQDFFDKLSEKEASYRLLIECREEIKAAIEAQQARWKASDAPFVVERLFTIATPIDTLLYTANMNVVKSLYVLSSAGDKVQSFFGKRRYKGAVNIRVAIESNNGGIYYPLHTKMRSSIVARYLLDLPRILEKKLGTALYSLKGIDALLPQRKVEPTFVRIESFSKRAFKASGF